MKYFQTSIFRAIMSIVVGLLLIKYREEMITWLTIAVGLLFFISGIISCTHYYAYAKRSNKEDIKNVYKTSGNSQKISFPIVGVGSIILGSILAFMPSSFILSVGYIFGVLLIIGALSQLVTLATLHRSKSVGFIYWVLPSLLLIIGIISVIKPSIISFAPILVIGWAIVCYGLIECINAIKIYNSNKVNNNITGRD